LDASKSKDVETRWSIWPDLAESSREGYGSNTVLLLLLLVMMMISALGRTTIVAELEDALAGTTVCLKKDDVTAGASSFAFLRLHSALPNRSAIACTCTNPQ
jgi:hypothetical protein